MKNKEAIDIKDEACYQIIKDLYDKSKGKHGYRMITMLLGKTEHKMNHKKIQRIMSKYKIKSKVRRKNPSRVSAKELKEHCIYPNLLDRDFDNRVGLSTDMSYLRMNNRFSYLSVIKSLKDKSIIAWELSLAPNLNLVIDTIKQLDDRDMRGYMIHSDQGFQYTNPLYSKMIKELGMIQSMSRRGVCLDNSPVESFFGHMKDEISIKECATIEEANKIVGEYIDYYNNHRPQWGLNKMTPVEYGHHLV